MRLEELLNYIDTELTPVLISDSNRLALGTYDKLEQLADGDLIEELKDRDVFQIYNAGDYIEIRIDYDYECAEDFITKIIDDKRLSTYGKLLELNRKHFLKCDLELYRELSNRKKYAQYLIDEYDTIYED